MVNPMIGYLRTFLVGVAIRFIATFPISIYGYATIKVWRGCFDDFASCAMVWMMAPFFLIVGPLGAPEEDPPSPFPTIVAVAAILAAVWTIVVLIRLSGANKRPS